MRRPWLLVPIFNSVGSLVAFAIGCAERSYLVCGISLILFGACVLAGRIMLDEPS